MYTSQLNLAYEYYFTTVRLTMTLKVVAFNVPAKPFYFCWFRLHDKIADFKRGNINFTPANFQILESGRHGIPNMFRGHLGWLNVQPRPCVHPSPKATLYRIVTAYFLDSTRVTVTVGLTSSGMACCLLAKSWVIPSLVPRSFHFSLTPKYSWWRAVSDSGRMLNKHPLITRPAHH